MQVRLPDLEITDRDHVAGGAMLPCPLPGPRLPERNLLRAEWLNQGFKLAKEVTRATIIDRRVDRVTGILYATHAGITQ